MSATKKKMRDLKRVNVRTAAKVWGPLTTHAYGGTIYAINNKVVVPYRWLTQKLLNNNPVQMMGSLEVRRNLARLTEGDDNTITAVVTYATNRERARMRAQEPTWTDLPDLQGVYSATVSSIQARSWTHLSTWVQLGNAVLVFSGHQDQPLAALVPPHWVDKRIDAGAPDVAQQEIEWTGKENLQELASEVANHPQGGHLHYDLKPARQHTVSMVDMGWLKTATGKEHITSTARLPLSMAHPPANPEDGPQVAVTSVGVASEVIKGLTPKAVQNLPLSYYVNPE